MPAYRAHAMVVQMTATPGCVLYVSTGGCVGYALYELDVPIAAIAFPIETRARLRGRPDATRAEIQNYAATMFSKHVGYYEEWYICVDVTREVVDLFRRPCYSLFTYRWVLDPGVPIREGLGFSWLRAVSANYVGVYDGDEDGEEWHYDS